MTWTWWPPCPNITVPLPSTDIRGVASFATLRPIIDMMPPWPPWMLGVKDTSPLYASIAPRWLNRRWPGMTVASTILELISRKGMSHIPGDRVALAGLDVHQAVALESDLEGLAAALAHERPERHAGLEGLVEVALVGDVGAGVHGQRVLVADAQHDGRAVGHDRGLAVALHGRGEQAVALARAAQAGEAGAG